MGRRRGERCVLPLRCSLAGVRETGMVEVDAVGADAPHWPTWAGGGGEGVEMHARSLGVNLVLWIKRGRQEGSLSTATTPLIARLSTELFIAHDVEKKNLDQEENLARPTISHFVRSPAPPRHVAHATILGLEAQQGRMPTAAIRLPSTTAVRRGVGTAIGRPEAPAVLL